VRLLTPTLLLVLFTPEAVKSKEVPLKRSVVVVSFVPRATPKAKETRVRAYEIFAAAKNAKCAASSQLRADVSASQRGRKKKCKVFKSSPQKYKNFCVFLRDYAKPVSVCRRDATRQYCLRNNSAHSKGCASETLSNQPSLSRRRTQKHFQRRCERCRKKSKCESVFGSVPTRRSDYLMRWRFRNESAHLSYTLIHNAFIRDSA
jgi:hypothetical protein